VGGWTQGNKPGGEKKSKRYGKKGKPRDRVTEGWWGRKGDKRNSKKIQKTKTKNWDQKGGGRNNKKKKGKGKAGNLRIFENGVN